MKAAVLDDGQVVVSERVPEPVPGPEPIVYPNTTIGGYAERMLLSAPLLLEVPKASTPRGAP